MKPTYTKRQRSYMLNLFQYYAIFFGIVVVGTIFPDEEGYRTPVSQILLYLGMAAIIALGHTLATHFANYEKED